MIHHERLDHQVALDALNDLFRLDFHPGELIGQGSFPTNGLGQPQIQRICGRIVGRHAKGDGFLPQ
jgi:hypothetical protein